MPAYFRFPYEGGALFAALEMPDLRLPAPRVQTIGHVVTEAVGRFDIDHQTAFTAYVEARGGRVTGDRNTPVARWPDGQTLGATFDSAGHLVRVEPTMNAGEGATVR